MSASDWPQILGPTRDGIYAGPTLAANWPKDGPPLLWQLKIGAGFAGPAVASGKLILFHRQADWEIIEALAATNGATLWKYDYPTHYRDDFGFDEGPRAVPTIVGGRVFAFGAEGELTALDFADGRRVWAHDCGKEFKAPKGFFGLACSPLVEGKSVILNIGGADGAGIVAFDVQTGQLLWKATDDAASYSSPVAADLGGQRTVLAFTRAGLVGLAPADGRERFRYPLRSRLEASVNAAVPLVHENMIFLSASYGTGAAMLRVTNARAEKVWSGDEILSNHYATCVLKDGFLFGFDGRQEEGQRLRCVEWLTGKVRWTKEGLGAGNLLLAGAELLVLTEGGELVRVAADPERYREIERAQILPSGVRAYPALADGLFFGRNRDTLVCADLRRGGTP